MAKIKSAKGTGNQLKKFIFGTTQIKIFHLESMTQILKHLNSSQYDSYEWDENKNQSNQQKHSISFEKAQEVFQDENAVKFRGNSSTELRIIPIGKTLSKILITRLDPFRSE